MTQVLVESKQVWTVECGDILLPHIRVENYGGNYYHVISNGEEIDVFWYTGDKPAHAVSEYLTIYAKQHGYA
jgi:hypothetical protein